MKKSELHFLAQAFVHAVLEAPASSLKELSSTFLQALHERHLRPRLKDLEHALDRAWKKEQGVSRISLTSAHALSKKQQDALLKSARGATVHFAVDPTLLSGAQLILDDTRIDASASGTLRQLHHTLVSSAS